MHLLTMMMCLPMVMLMPQIASSKSSDKQRKPHQHAYTFPTEMTLGSNLLMLSMIVPLCALMDHISGLTAIIHTTILVLMLFAISFVLPVINLIHDDTHHHSNHKKHGKNQQRLLGNHRQHHKSLIPGRSDHHSHKSTKTEQTMSIK